MLTPFWRWVTSPTVRYGGHPDVSLILPNLLVGEYPTPDDAGWLRQCHGVTSVVCLQDFADLASKGLELHELQQAYRAHHVAFHHVPVPDCDVETLSARLDGLVALLSGLVSEGERVYLHCNAGLNRAPTVAIAYVHVEQGLPLGAARDFVKGRRQCAPYMTVLEARYGGSAG